jgi:DNA-binding transcriptional regulator YhcF (GntR family)
MPQHEPVPVDDIIAFASTPKEDGTLPSRPEVAANFGVNVVTVNKALLSSPRHKRPDWVEARVRSEGNRVLEELKRYMAENGYAPSQRELAEATGLMTSRVNYLLRALEVQGIIEVFPGARAIRIVGAKMVIPNVTM